MRQDKKLKVVIFEDDPVILKLFQGLFVFQGHDVLTFTEPTGCPLYSKADCDCPRELPCADVLIADMQMDQANGIEFFEKQRKHGCKALPANKLLLGDALTPEQQSAIGELGCRFIKKPFNTFEVVKWLEGCARRSYR